MHPISQSTVEAINGHLQAEFPETYNENGFSRMLSERAQLAIEFAEREGRDLCTSTAGGVTYLHRKMRGEDLAAMMRVLGTNIDKDPVAALRPAFSGKRILSIGDDTGSLTEVLNHIGAEAVGLEYDRHFVTLAHSGAMAEDYSSQSQVVQGDAWQLLFPDSEITKQVMEDGLYDLVFTNNFFDIGSGGEIPQDQQLQTALAFQLTEAAVNRFGAHFVLGPSEMESGRKMWFQYFMAGAEQLLTPGGMQLHLNTEFGKSVGARQLTIRAYDPATKSVVENTTNHVLEKHLYK